MRFGDYVAKTKSGAAEVDAFVVKHYREVQESIDGTREEPLVD